MLLLPRNPSSSLHLFCDSSATGRRRSSWSNPEWTGWLTATVAKGLKTVSVSFFVEARIFLEFSSSRNLQFPRLENLVWTSAYLSRDVLSADSSHVADLLLDAATLLARRMPKLKFLDIWYAEDGDAFIARLTRDPHLGILYVHWHSTWHDDDGLNTPFAALSERWAATGQEGRSEIVCSRAPFTASTEGGGWHPTGYEELASCILDPETRREILERCAAR